MSDKIIPYTIYNQKVVNFLYRLEDMLNSEDSEYFIRLAGNSNNPNNIVDRIKYKSHRHVVIALLKAANFCDEDFTFACIPHFQRIALYYYELNGNNLPEEVELEANIDCYYGFTATQKAVLNMNTFELSYTTYTARVDGCFNTLHGVGKLPINEECEFDFSRHISV